jgi:hypothetical protein
MAALFTSLAMIGVSFGQEQDEQSRMGLFGPDMRYVDPIELTDQEPERRWTNPFADWKWRPRPIQWKTPEFLQRMSADSQRMWRKTKRNVSHWASSTGAAIRRSTGKTWNTITRTSWSWTREDETPEPLSPSFGGVNEFLSRPKLKF